MKFLIDEDCYMSDEYQPQFNLDYLDTSETRLTKYKKYYIFCTSFTKISKLPKKVKETAIFLLSSDVLIPFENITVEKKNYKLKKSNIISRIYPNKSIREIMLRKKLKNLKQNK